MAIDRKHLQAWMNKHRVALTPEAIGELLGMATVPSVPRQQHLNELRAIAIWTRDWFDDLYPIDVFIWPLAPGEEALSDDDGPRRIRECRDLLARAGYRPKEPTHTDREVHGRRAL
ncbi:MAG: hypothetical protein Q8R97_05400 [Brevundimonas sp.]|nr:hypothetical protein [Brevundimonas sp.]